MPTFLRTKFIDLKIYDELNALIPFNLLNNVIAEYKHRKGFRLRIALDVGVIQSGVNPTITSVRFIATNLSNKILSRD